MPATHPAVANSSYKSSLKPEKPRYQRENMHKSTKESTHPKASTHCIGGGLQGVPKVQDIPSGLPIVEQHQVRGSGSLGSGQRLRHSKKYMGKATKRQTTPTDLLFDLPKIQQDDARQCPGAHIRYLAGSYSKDTD